MARKIVKFEYHPYAFYSDANEAILCSVSVHLYDAKGNSLEHCFGIPAEWAAMNGPRVGRGIKYAFEHASNIVHEAFDRKRMLEALGYRVVGCDIGWEELCNLIDSCIAEKAVEIEDAA